MTAVVAPVAAAPAARTARAAGAAAPRRAPPPPAAASRPGVPSSPPTTSGTRLSTRCRSTLTRMPMSPRSELDTGLHADFGSGLYDGRPIGIPFVSVPKTQPGVPVEFYYADESDPGPYPIPDDAPIEGGICGAGDRHVLIVQAETCRLYELFAATPRATGGSAGSGAIFDLRSQRVAPGGVDLGRRRGVADPARSGPLRGSGRRAISTPCASRRRTTRKPTSGRRVTKRGRRLTRTCRRWGSASASGPPSTSPDSRLPTQVILTALKTYGMILADNGGRLVPLRRSRRTLEQ